MIPSEALESETMALARVIAANPPIAIRLAKLLIREGLGTDLESSQQFAAAAQAICFASDDYKEAIAAFREKRQAHFRAK